MSNKWVSIIMVKSKRNRAISDAACRLYLQTRGSYEEGEGYPADLPTPGDPDWPADIEPAYDDEAAAKDMRYEGRESTTMDQVSPDRYELIIWPAPNAPVEVLKTFKFQP